MGMSLSKLREFGDGQGSLACCDSWGRKESDTTERLHWTELNCVAKNIRNGKEVFLSWYSQDPSVSLGLLGLHLLSIQCILFCSASPAATRVRPALLFNRDVPSLLCWDSGLCASASLLPPPYLQHTHEQNWKKYLPSRSSDSLFFHTHLMVLLHAHYPSVASHCCRKGDPFQGPKLGSRLTLGKELSEETHVLTKQEISLGKGSQVESRRVREPRRTALPCGLQSYGDGISFRVVFSQSFWLRVLPGGARLVQPRWMPERRILESVGQVVSPSDLFWTLLVGGGLLVPSSLPGPPVVKQLMQMVTMVPGQGGRFRSVCFP